MHKQAPILTQAALGFVVVALALTPAALAAPSAPSGFNVVQFAAAPGSATGPDDVAALGDAVAVAFQNGIGPAGEPSPSGATQSDVVLYASSGAELADWKVTGHVDGLAADPRYGEIIATVNEDGNTSLFTIDGRDPAETPVQYAFSPEPDSAHGGGVFTGGGTDGVQVIGHDRLLVSASAPNDGSGGPVPSATATFLVTLDRHSHVAHLAPTFADDATATDALTNATVTLGPPGANPEALTDPDSNALVPGSSPLYAGQYMLNSQGDQLLVFAGARDDRRDGGQLDLTELPLNREGVAAGVDDVAWATAESGTLYVVDHSADVVYAVSGPFSVGQSFASLDTVGAAANNTEVDRLDLASGTLTPFITGLGVAKGLLFVPSYEDGQDVSTAAANARRHGHGDSASARRGVAFARAHRVRH